MRFNIKDLFGVTVLLAFYLSAVIYAIPYEFDFDGGVPWGPVLASVVAMWLIAIIGRWLPEGTFFVLSFPFLTLAVLALIFRRAYVSEKGICYLMFFPWHMTEVVANEDNVLNLKIGSSWLGLSIDVPPKLQTRVNELMADSSKLQRKLRQETDSPEKTE